MSGVTECHVDNFVEVLITFLGILTNCHVFYLVFCGFIRIFRVVEGGRVLHEEKKRVK